MTNHRWIPLVISGSRSSPCCWGAGRGRQRRPDRRDTASLLTATGLVLLMTPGLAFFYAGMVGTKNVISTMLQSFIALSVISLWVVV